MDEILVKGTDGKWYILKGEELLPYEEKGLGARGQGLVMKELPKGVTREEYEKMGEKSEIRSTKLETISNIPARGGSALGGQSPISKPIASAPVSHEEHPLRVELEELIDQVMKNVKFPPKADQPQAEKIQNVDWLGDPVLSKRFRMIVSARLREVRDATETREMLTRNRRIGGLEISELDTTLVVEIIEKAFKEFQAKWKAMEEKRRQERRRAQYEAQAKQVQLLKKKEEEELEERYRRLTGVSSKPKITIPKPPPPPAPVISQPPKPARLPASLPAVIPPPPPPPIQKTENRRQKTEALPTLRPTPYALRPTPSKVTDIRPAPKLLGPVDELQSLTLEDFRKLAGTVDERVTKISGKIEFIGQESLARRLAAIAAWKKSPLYGLYAKITGEALYQKVAPETLASGEATLTREEFYAIMELNQKLRF
ncbi:hypothetical protein HYW17_01575 [Candidatus Uhrbacteria bacterium]|nr:hypothetical protein [Candidatus Uhrbacteria bacterium]